MAGVKGGTYDPAQDHILSVDTGPVPAGRARIGQWHFHCHLRRAGTEHYHPHGAGCAG